MIRIGDCEIKISGCGLFSTDRRWIHPAITEKTYEIICMLSGEAYISEDGKEYHLTKGSVIILKPGFHKGYKYSYGRTEFYWLHFFCDDLYRDLPIKSNVFEKFGKAHLFKEIIHSVCAAERDIVSETKLAYLLGELCADGSAPKSKLAAEVYAWIGANSNARISVSDVGEHFGYNCEYLTKLIKNYYGISVKALINTHIIRDADNYLCNSDFSVKQIADVLGFDSPNAFVNYYKYHKGMSPSKFRNSAPLLHINSK